MRLQWACVGAVLVVCLAAVPAEAHALEMASSPDASRSAVPHDPSYDVQSRDKETLAAANRANRFRSEFTAAGLEVEPDEDAPASWRFGLRTLGYGRGEAWIASVATGLGRDGNRVEIRRGNLLEWYRNDRRGLKHGFTLGQPPEGERIGPLVVEMEITGNLLGYPTTDGQAVTLKTPQGSTALRYRHLLVTDANGVELPARMEVAVKRLRIVVDDAAAVYPIDIDPLLTSPSWILTEVDVGAEILSPRTAGDVNADGYSDLVMGAPSGTGCCGMAFAYYGSASGPLDISSWGANYFPGSEFASSITTAGDVNADGYDDVIIGAWKADSERGEAILVLGSEDGLEFGVSPWIEDGLDPGEGFGRVVAPAGDVNGDGHDDVIIGSANATRAYVFLGTAAATALETFPIWVGEEFGGDYGAWVAPAGDVDGDDFDDVLVADPAAGVGGTVYLYRGTAGGPEAFFSWSYALPQAGMLGEEAMTAGDVNGDGYSDVVFGAPLYTDGESEEGAAFAFFGSAGGLSLSPDWTFASDQAGAHLGGSVSTAGDLNGDGYADIVVGAADWTSGAGAGAGAVWVFHGSPAGPVGDPTPTVEGDTAGLGLGISVAVAGDLDGDGLSDVVIQSNDDVSAYFGSTEAPTPSPVTTLTGANNYGHAVAMAGDVNGDGFTDVLVGERLYSGGEANEGKAYVYHGSAVGVSPVPDWEYESNLATVQFGRSLSSAGDVNGDGYDDVVLSAREFDLFNPVPSYLFVFHGSASGLSLTPDWQYSLPMDDDGFPPEFVASAGDVNGDGYGDIIWGRPDDNTGATNGRVYVFHGSPTGLPASPSWEASGQDGGLFGSNVASAGDVNGDGYGDVIIGAEREDNGEENEGRAYVYLGSATGLEASPWWTAEGNQPWAIFGNSVASAGDIDGDGYGDVIVSAPWYDVTFDDLDPLNGSLEGRAFVYHGSPTGLSLGAEIIGDVPEAALGFGSNCCTSGVGSAGDVNGDGYGDVIVGLPFPFAAPSAEARFDVYLGSATGLSSAPAMTDSAELLDQEFGNSVAGGGDVNGDGYGDIVVGAWETSMAHVYHGNNIGTAALERVLQQYRVDDTAPIGLLGRSDDPDAFRVRMTGRHPAGRGDIRLEVEVDPFIDPFDGGGTVVTAPVDTGDPASGSTVEFNIEITGFLLPQTPYRWRARILTDSALFPDSPWFGLQGNALTQWDLRTPDTTNPWVQSISPGIRAEQTNRSTNITAIFSEPINPATVTDMTFRLTDDALAVIPTGLAVTPDGLKAALDPVSPLGLGTQYTIEVTAGVEDVGGMPLLPFTSTFTTTFSPVNGIPLPAVSDEALGLDSGSLTGAAVSGAGDLDGDGINDFLGGAPGLTIGGKAEAGAAAVYFGSTLGSERTSADILFLGAAAHDRAGVSVSGDFDFNGDSIPDILIGAEQVNRSGVDDVGCTDGSSCGPGKVYLIYFDPSDTGLYPNIGDPLLKDFVDLSLVGTTVPGVVFEGVTLGDKAGFSLDGGGRFDPGAGDDIVIGAPGVDTAGGAGAGQVYVVFDDPALSGTVSLSRVANGLGDEIPGVIYWGAAAGDELGFAVDWPGNVVGGPGDDLAFSAPRADPIPPGPIQTGGLPPVNDGGIVYVADGGDEVSSIIESCTVGGSTDGAQYTGDQEEMLLGFSLSGGGDNLVDGEDDLLMGAPLYDAPSGADAGQVVQTSSVVPNGSIIESCTVGGTTNGIIYLGATAGDQLGYAVEGVGDATGNGLDDVTFGAPFSDPNSIDEAGSVTLVEGALPATLTLGSVDVVEVGMSISGLTLTGVEEGEHAGSSIAETGDISGDGENDFVVGAPDNDLFAPDDSAGQIYLVLDTDLAYSDVDGDGVSDKIDCNINDAGIWKAPGAVTDLSMTHDAQAGETLLTWSAPAAGATQLRYDVIRAASPGTWTDGAVCVEIDDVNDTQAVDDATLGSGETVFYLVRAENDCPDGLGSVGVDHEGQPRLAILCPNLEDGDGDGANDDTDNCPAIPNDQADLDGDGVGDACDNCVAVSNVDQVNSDNDSFGDACDNCAAVDNEDQLNSDADSFGDVCDNCVEVDNESQANNDADSHGDACDNCPTVDNESQANNDADSHGNACDNCTVVDNEDQLNSDADSHGDACDNCPTVDNESQSNNDADSHGNACDNCDSVANEDQANSDADSRGDACDNCPTTDNESQTNSDADSHGDACDNCPTTDNESQSNNDADSHGDACDNCPVDDNEDQANNDTDSHGNVCDNCPDDDNEDQLDTDGDGAGDVCDVEGPTRTVFASSTTFNGDLGGLAGADATCNALASAAGLLGTYKAWLSDDCDSPSTTFVQSAIPYTLVDGTIVATDWADLTDGTLQNSISLDENGAPVTGQAWTGTLTDGTPSAAQKCSTAAGAWTQPVGSKIATGASGITTQASSQWTVWTQASCGLLQRIYCFEQVLPEGCGNGVTDTGEDCDDAGESATCDADCTAVRCGDGELNETAGEECDDGGTTPGDGCDGSCQEEVVCDITVSNTNDSGAGSLRDAVAAANPGETICIQATGTITLTSGTINVTQALKIVGPGADMLTVDGNGAVRAFDISLNPVAISGITVTGAQTGIYAVSPLTLSSSTITGNVSAGVHIQLEDGEITSSTISANSNGLWVQNSGCSTVTVQSSTLSSNTASALYASYGGNVVIRSSTLVGGTVPLYVYDSTVAIRNSIISGGSNGNCYLYTGATLISDGHNLSSDNSCAASLTQPSDQNNVNPLLGALGNNGGPTATHALGVGSPAIDAGTCPGETEDQRGSPRPVDDPGVPDGSAGFCDVGAYEKQ